MGTVTNSSTFAYVYRLCKDDIEQRKSRWEGSKRDDGRRDDGMDLGKMKVMRMMAIDARKTKKRRKKKGSGGPNQKVIDQLMHKVECHLFDSTFPRRRGTS